MMQCSLEWSNTLAKVLEKFEFEGTKLKRLLTDRCVWAWRNKNGKMLIMGTHVDDTIMGCNHQKLQDALMAHMRENFPVQDYEPVSCFLSVGMKQDMENGTVVLDQKGAVDGLVQELGISKCHKKVPLPPGVKVLPFEGKASDSFRKEYQSKVAKAIYLQGCNPSISQAVSKLASVACNPGPQHMKLLDNYLLPFLSKPQTGGDGIRFSRQSCHPDKNGKDPAFDEKGNISDKCSIKDFKLQVWVDANFIEDFIDCKCRGGVMIRMVGGPLECMSKKQPLTASHTQEAEHIEMAIGQTKAKSAINFLIECGFPADSPIPTFEDNMAACKLATEHINTSRSKHIPLQHHIVKENVMKDKIFSVFWCPTEWQLADMFTKSLSAQKFEELDEHVRGHKDRDFESTCTFIEPGVW
jgi:hypothetical protein